MIRKKINLSEERKLVTYMIVNPRFLKEVAPLIRINQLQSSYAKIVVKWILEYWENFKDAPGKNIQEIYAQKKKTIYDEDEERLVKKFLLRLSEDWEKVQEVKNVEFLVKNSVNYLKLQSLRYLREQIDKSVLEANPTTGEQAISNYKRIEKPEGEGVLLYNDYREIMQAFTDTDEILFRFPGELGKVMGDFLRGDLIAFLSASNRGKTWWQMYVSLLASYYGYRVVFFSLEMTKNQVVRRFWQGIVGAGRKDEEIEIPYFVKNDKNKEKKYKVEIRKEKIKGVQLDKIKEEQKKLKLHVKGGNVKMVILPHYSATVTDIEAHLDNMIYYDNYIPDVVVVDYADIVASELRGEYRHKIDDIWKRLRKMAQDRNILTASASQATRAAFKKDAGESDIAEDIRKYTHLSKMFVLNQKPDEYERGIMRLGQIKERDGKRSYKKVIVLQCLDIGRPYLDSKLEDDVEI